jgi:tetratricopeptide (TPR) repeat protein
MTRRAIIWAALVASTLLASPAHAQKEQFVAGVRDLVAATTPADTSRSAVQAAADRMAAALAQWDRTISAIDARIVKDLEGASGRRAYELHLELGVIYLERGRLADALRHLDLASSAESAASDAQILRAVALEAAGKHDEAARQWQVVWGLDRANPVKAYQVLRSSPVGAATRPAAAAVMKAAYERLLSAEEQPRPLSVATIDIVPDTFSATPVVGTAATAEAFAHIAEARYDDALAAFGREAPAGEPSRARFARAQEYEKANRVREARREYEAAIAGTLSGRSLLYLGIGRLAQVEGDFAGAIEAFRHAVQLNPNDVNLHRELAFAYAGQGAVDEAFHELVAALLLNPRDAKTFADIGRLFLDAGQDAEALPPLRRALALAPGMYETRYAIATSLTRLGRTDDAARELAAFERAQREMLDRQRQGLAVPGQDENAASPSVPPGSGR